MNTPDEQFRSQLQVTKLWSVGYPNLNFWGLRRPDTYSGCTTGSGGGGSSGCGSDRGSCGSR